METDTAVAEKVEIRYGVPPGIRPEDVARMAAEGGVMFEHISAFTGISVVTLGQQSNAKGWVTPARSGWKVRKVTEPEEALMVLMRAAHDLRAKRVEEMAEIEDRSAMLDIIEGRVKGAEVDEIMARIATRHRVRLANKLLEQVAESQPVVKTVTDLRNADDMIRRSMGVQDKDGKAAVNISILGGGKGVREAKGKVVAEG